MKKKFLAAAIGAMLVGGSAFAGLTDTVRVSGDGVGDLLIAPAYFIGGGMTTDLKVINTDLKRSVVAKVVFHHPTSSAEVLDFLIYLTPGDVWTGTVSCVTVGADGNCAVSQVKSADSSIQLDGQDVFASAANPAVILSSGERPALPNQGYVTIMESRAANVLNPQGKLAPGVLKTAVKADYDAALIANLSVGPNETPNVLTGTVTANAGALGSATLPMTAIKDFDNSLLQVVGINTGWDATYHSVKDLEDALWGDNFVVPYKVAADALSLVTFTFPTKLAYDGKTAPVSGQYPFGTAATNPDPSKTDSCNKESNALCMNKIGAADVGITAQAFDNEENTLAGLFNNVSPLPPSKSTLVSEFGWKLIGSDLKADLKVGSFTEGWLKVGYTAPVPAAALQSNGNVAVNAGRTGVPSLVTVMNKQAGNFTWAYAASAQ